MTITPVVNIDELVDQIKEMKRLRRIKILVSSDAHEIKERCGEICRRVLKLNQHPYLSVFVEDVSRKQRHVMKRDEENIFVSNDQWEETISKEKDGDNVRVAMGETSFR